MSIVVLMPTRGRLAKAREAIEAFDATKSMPGSRICAVIDRNDPDPWQDGSEGYVQVDEAHSGQGMGPALNGALQWFPDATIFGFVGDDHRFRTSGWDAHVTSAMLGMGGGLVYGNDLIRGEELPTQVFIDARIVRALGWMALPGAKHLYLDDTWRELGKRMKRLKYLSDVVIEHMHPIAQKADWDEGYARVNDPALYDHDRHVYSNWLKDDLERDAAKALEALR